MKHPLTRKALERAARALALACNGGSWTREYTPAQRQLWRNRVTRAIEDPTNEAAANPYE